MSKKRRTNIVIPEEPSKGPSLFVDIILLFIAPPISTIVGLYLLFKRFKYEVTHREFAEFRRYAAIIGDRSSISLREKVRQLLEEHADRVENIDSIIIAQRPKMMPHLPRMRQNIADALHVDVDRISVKATTQEGLGFTGREEGIAAQAVCMLEKI